MQIITAAVALSAVASALPIGNGHKESFNGHNKLGANAKFSWLIRSNGTGSNNTDAVDKMSWLIRSDDLSPLPLNTKKDVIVSINSTATEHASPISHDSASGKDFVTVNGKVFWLLKRDIAEIVPGNSTTTEHVSPIGHDTASGKDFVTVNGKVFWLLKRAETVPGNSTTAEHVSPINHDSASGRDFVTVNGKVFWLLKRGDADIVPVDSTAAKGTATIKELGAWAYELIKRGFFGHEVIR